MEVVIKSMRKFINNIDIWYQELGSREPLLMLHPGGYGSVIFEVNQDELSKHFHLYLPDRRGHGNTPDAEGGYTFDMMTDDTIAFIEQVIGMKTRIFGMSDGAIIGLLVAQKRPDLVECLICAGGVFHYSGWSDGVLSKAETRFENLLEQKLHDMHISSPTLTVNDLKSITTRTLVMVGDDDEPIFEHTLTFYQNLPNGELAVVPGTSHGLLIEKPELCNAIMLDFFRNDPVQTYAPIRRRTKVT